MELFVETIHTDDAIINIDVSDLLERLLTNPYVEQ